jgi:Tfp pilus assembly protein PilO
MKLWRRVFEERRGVVLPLLVFVIANAAILALAVLPLRRSVVGYEEQSREQAMKLTQARTDNKNATAAKARKEEADLELKKFYSSVLPSDQASSMRLVLFWVSQAARDARVTFASSTAGSEVIRESRLQKVKCHVILRGDYQDIRKFLYVLETAQQFVVVENVELAQSGQTGAAQGNQGALEVGLDVATYFLGS